MALRFRMVQPALVFLLLAAAGYAQTEPGHRALAHAPMQTEERGVRGAGWPQDEGALFALAGVAMLTRAALLHRDRPDGRR